jgi:hypothetical protein
MINILYFLLTISFYIQILLLVEVWRGLAGIVGLYKWSRQSSA